MSQYMGGRIRGRRGRKFQIRSRLPFRAAAAPTTSQARACRGSIVPDSFSLHRSGKRTLVFACVPSWMTVLCAFGERFRFVSALPKRREEGGGGVSLGHLGVPISNAKKGEGGRGTIPHVIPREEAKKTTRRMTTTRRRSKTLLPISLSLSAVSSFRFSSFFAHRRFLWGQQASLAFLRQLRARVFLLCCQEPEISTSGLNFLPIPCALYLYPRPAQESLTSWPLLFSLLLLLPPAFFLRANIDHEKRIHSLVFFRALPIQYQGSPP